MKTSKTVCVVGMEEKRINRIRGKYRKLDIICISKGDDYCRKEISSKYDLVIIMISFAGHELFEKARLAVGKDRVKTVTGSLSMLKRVLDEV